MSSAGYEALPVQDLEPGHRLSHIARRRDNLAKVLDVAEVRGVPLDRLLAHGAALFADQGRAAREDPVGTFAQSEPVPALDFFVSHSWRSARISKYAALLDHFNAAVAFLVTDAACYLALLPELMYFDDLPAFFVHHGVPRQVDFGVMDISFFSTCVSSLVLIAVLLFGHHLGARVHLFLDIACIRQDNADEKAMGIEQLGAVLDRTRTIICLLDEFYWTRLWCVFEVAAFYKRAGPHRMVFIPLHHTDLRILSVLFSCANSVVAGPLVQVATSLASYMGLTGLLLQNAVLVLVLVPFCTTQVWLVMRGFRSQQALEALRDFRLSAAECYDDDDRDALLALIAQWFTDYNSGETDPKRLRELGWHRFESIVRRDIPLLLEKNSGVGMLATVRALLPASVLGMLTFFLPAVSNPEYTLGATFLLFAQCIPVLLTTLLTATGLQLGARLAARLQAGCEGALGRVAALLAGAFIYQCIVFSTVWLTNLATPVTLLLDPQWRFPDDGLDPLTRINFKASFCFVIGIAATYVQLGFLAK